MLLNYYAIYHLDRSASTRDLRRQLRSEQGKIKQMLSAGSLNDPSVMEKLTTADMEIQKAILAFKNDSTRQEYDNQLDAAIPNGAIDTTTESQIETLLDEIRELYNQYQWGSVIGKCREAINDNITDVEVYSYMARSYAYLNHPTEAIKAAEEAVDNNPRNKEALVLANRMICDYNNDYNKATFYVDQIQDLDEKGDIYALEKAYLCVKNNRLDEAFGVYDKYISNNATDIEFRQKAAFDMLGCAEACYKEDPTGQTEVRAITSKEDYDLSYKLSEQAAKVYNNDKIQEFFEYTKSFGELEKNSEITPISITNKIANTLMIGVGIFYIVYILYMVFTSVISFGMGLVALAFLGVCFFIGQKKNKKKLQRIANVQYRPKWQTYKYEFYGERELEEMGVIKEWEKDKAFVIKGTKLGLKATWEIVKRMM